MPESELHELQTTEKGRESCNHSEDDANNQPIRQTWTSQLDYVMMFIGAAVGLGNIWRFPYLCFKNGGGAFLVPYLVCFVLAAAPGFILEVSVGQYMSLGVTKAWNLLPVLQGIGFASEIVLIYGCVYYVVILAWTLNYMTWAFTSEIPWASCNNTWNTDRCFHTGMKLKALNCSTQVTAIDNVTDTMNCSSSTSLAPIDAVEEFWNYRILDMSSGIENIGSLVPGLTVSLLISWTLVFLCICRGVKWTGKIVYFTAVFPYLLLFTLIIRGVTLEGAGSGLVYYLRPDFSRLADAQVWLDGATQIIYSQTLAQGIAVSFGSYNKFNSNIVRNNLIIMTVNIMTSLIGGLAVFSVLGFMAHETQQPIDNVVSSGPGLVFLTYPKAVTQMPLPQLWAILFFLMILFVGLDSQFGSVEALLASIFDHFPHTLYKPRNRMIATFLCCFVGFLLGLLHVTQGGIYVFRIFDYYACSGMVLLLILFLEYISVGWIFGADRFCDCIELMSGVRPSSWFKICWKYTAPLVIQGIFWFQIITWKPLKFDQNYEYPIWATGLGIAMLLSSVLFVPGVALYKLTKAGGTLKQRWQSVTTPELHKHQIHHSWLDNRYRWSFISTSKTQI